MRFLQCLKKKFIMNKLCSSIIVRYYKWKSFVVAILNYFKGKYKPFIWGCQEITRKVMPRHTETVYRTHGSSLQLQGFKASLDDSLCGLDLPGELAPRQRAEGMDFLCPCLPVPGFSLLSKLHSLGNLLFPSMLQPNSLLHFFTLF